MPADEHFEARTWGNGRLSGTPTSGGGLTDLEVRIGQALAEVPTQAELDTALESVASDADLAAGLAAKADASALAAKADLSGGTVPLGQIPASVKSIGRSAAPKIAWPSGLVAFFPCTGSYLNGDNLLSADGVQQWELTKRGAAPTFDATIPGPFGASLVLGGPSSPCVWTTALDGSDIGALDLSRHGDQGSWGGWFFREDVNISHAFGGNHTEGAVGVNAARQYCIYCNITGSPSYEGRNRWCPHVSGQSGPTPGHPYNVTFGIDARMNPPGRWEFVVATFDGRTIRTYVDGQLHENTHYTDPREGSSYDAFRRVDISKNPHAAGDYSAGGFNPVQSPVQVFSLGAQIQAKSPFEAGNPAQGRMGGYFVFNRVLTPDEINRIHLATLPPGYAITRHDFYSQVAGSLRASTYGLKAMGGGLAQIQSDLIQTPGFSIQGAVLAYGYLGRLNPDANAALAWYPLDGLTSLASVRRVVVENASETGANNRLAIKVGSQWYVSNSTLDVSTNWSGTSTTIGSDVALTIANNRFTKASHGLVDGDRVNVSGANAAGFWQATTYYVVGSASGYFSLALTAGGSAIVPTADVGAVTVTKRLGDLTTVNLDPSAGQWRLATFDEAQTLQRTATITNYVQQPSYEGSPQSNWAKVEGGGATATVSQGTVNPYAGAGTYKLTLTAPSTTTNVLGITNNCQTLPAAGSRISASMFVRSSKTGQGQKFAMSVQFKDASNANVSVASGESANGPVTEEIPGTWTKVTWRGTVPATATSVIVKVTASSAGTAWATNDTFEADGCMVTDGSMPPLDYFDGSTAPGNVAGPYPYGTTAVSGAEWYSYIGNAALTIANNRFTLASHGLAAGDTVRVSNTGGGFTAGVDYYVSATNLTSGYFSLSATNGGAVITPSADVGSIPIVKTTPHSSGSRIQVVHQTGQPMTIAGSATTTRLPTERLNAVAIYSPGGTGKVTRILAIRLYRV